MRRPSGVGFQIGSRAVPLSSPYYGALSNVFGGRIFIELPSSVWTLSRAKARNLYLNQRCGGLPINGNAVKF